MKIIAELGSNWKTFEDCKNAINLAKACGADAIKFQMFSREELYGLPFVLSRREIEFDEAAKEYLGVTFKTELWERIKKNELQRDWIKELKIKADAAGIEFMCTAFSPEGYRFIDSYVSTHKVASAECTHLRILETLRDLGKPVIISTGGHTPHDIRVILHVLAGGKCEMGSELFTEPKIPVTLMYCVSAYPANEIDFRQLEELKLFNQDVGYSDHSTDILCVPKLAMEHGADVLEKHFNPFNYTDTPDAPHSLNTDQFKKMVQNLKGNLPFVWGSNAENPMRLQHNRRVIAIQDIEVGQTFQEGVNFGCYRSRKDDTRGLSPFIVDYVRDKTALRMIKEGEGIGPGDF